MFPRSHAVSSFLAAVLALPGSGMVAQAQPSVQPAAAASPAPAGAPPAAVNPADIVYALDPANLQTYRYATLGCLGANRYWWEWGGGQGRYLTPPPFPLFDASGALRAGVVPDPGNAAALAFELSVMPDDGDVSGVGTKRCEMALGWTEFAYPGKTPTRTATLPRNQDFWWALKFRLADWRSTTDRQVIFQWLPTTPTSAGPIMSADVWGSRLRLEIHYDFGATPSEQTMTKLMPWTLEGWQPNRWYTLAIRGRIDDVTPSNSRIELWLDGRKVLDYDGPIGYMAATGSEYAKFGLYHWTKNNPWDMTVVRRTAWYKGPTLIIDRGAYDVAKVTRFLD